MILVLLGAPGAGKGTLAAHLTKKMDVPSVSTGNILREAIASDTPLGREAKQYMDEGRLVPDQLVINLLRERVAEEDCRNGYILDGFPRTIPQARALDEIADIDCVLSLEVPDKTIEDRMTGRRVCLKCGATYHIIANPPRVEGVCNECGSPLHIRKDDLAEVVRGRLVTFHEQTEPLKEYYGAQGKVKSIDGTQAIARIAAEAEEKLGL